MYARVLLFVFILFSLKNSCQANLLTDQEMADFVDQHRPFLVQLQEKEKYHMGYAVVEFAKQQMVRPDFGDDLEAEEKERVFYASVIVSALRGIGFGGISQTKKASPSETRSAYLALYAIGLNLPDFESYFDIKPKKQTEKDHFSSCQKIVEWGKLVSLKRDTFTYVKGINATRRPEQKEYEAADFRSNGLIFKKYSFLKNLNAEKTRQDQEDQVFGQKLESLKLVQTIRKLFKNKKVLNQKATPIVFAYAQLRKNENYKLHLSYRSDFKEEGFAFLCFEKTLRGALFQKSATTWSLKPNVKKDVRSLWLAAHPDKWGTSVSEYDSDVTSIINDLYKSVSDFDGIYLTEQQMLRLGTY